MNINSVNTTFSIMTPAKLARSIGVTHRAASKAKEKKYFPSDWYERIVIATDGKVTFKQLFSDLYIHKYGIVPQVARSKAQKLCLQLTSCELGLKNDSKDEAKS